jgi:hypothetical protein
VGYFGGGFGGIKCEFGGGFGGVGEVGDGILGVEE